MLKCLGTTCRDVSTDFQMVICVCVVCVLCVCMCVCVKREKEQGGRGERETGKSLIILESKYWV